MPTGVDFAPSVKVEARFEEAKSAIVPQLTGMIDSRDALGKKLSDLESRILDLRSAGEKAEQELQDLQTERASIALSGGDVMKLGRKRRELETRIEDIDGAISDLEAAVVEAERQGVEAQEGLFDLWMAVQAEYLAGAQEKFNDLHRALSEFHAAYALAMRQLYAEIMREGDFPRFHIRHPRGVAPKPIMPLRVDRAFSIYTVNERLESASLNAILK